MLSELKQKKHLFWTALILSFLAAIPALLIVYVSKQYSVELEKNLHEERRNTAQIAIIKMQKELIEQRVVNNALGDFSKLTEKHFARQGINSKSVKAAETAFLKRFSRKSEIYWFDRNFNAITPENKPFTMSKRSLSAFAKAIAGAKMTKTEVSAADRFTETFLAGFLKADYFKEIYNNAKLMMYRAVPQYAAFFRVGSGRGQNRGYMLVFIPKYSAREHWLEKRALYRLNLHEDQVKYGIIHLSRNEFIGHSEISPRLLADLSKCFLAGDKEFEDEDTYYRLEKHPGQMSMIIAVSLKKAQKNLDIRDLIKAVNVLVWIPALLFLLMPFYSPADIFDGISLRTRFYFATTTIIILPLLLNSVYGAMNTAMVGMEMQKEEYSRLESDLTQLEESIALERSYFADYLRTGLVPKYSYRMVGSPLAENIYNELTAYSCTSVVFINQKDGEAYWAPDSDKSLSIDERNKTAILLYFINSRLENSGFDTKKLSKTFPLPSGSEVFNLDLLAIRGYSDSVFFDNIRHTELSGYVYTTFCTFFTNREGKIMSCLIIAFDHNKMQDQLLARQNMRLSEDKRIFYRSTVINGRSKTPKNKFLAEILESGQFSTVPLKSIVTLNGVRYQIYVRALDGLEDAGMVIKRLTNDVLNPRNEQIFILLLTVILSLVIASFVINFFSQYFLQPVLKLSELAGKVNSGILEIPPEIPGNNEISTLNKNFTQMIAGLKEKAEMRNYLRADLFDIAAEERTVSAERTEVTILFFGIRNFSRLEDQLTPVESMQIMSSFLEVCEKAVKENGGDIDKFIGDTAMAAFRGKSKTEAEENAANASLQILKNIEILRAERSFLKGMAIGGGFNSGTVIAGQIGSQTNRLDYTFIGDAVNLAARLEKLAGKSGTSQILTTSEAAERLSGKFKFKELAPMPIKGKSGVICVSELEGPVSGGKK